MGKKFIALFLCMSLLVCSALTGCSTNTTADGHEVKIIRVALIRMRITLSIRQ